MPLLPPLPPIADQPLSVVLLAHNEEAQLETVVNEWLTFLNGLGRDYEVLLVDEGSTDGTVQARRPWRPKTATCGFCNQRERSVQVPLCARP